MSDKRQKKYPITSLPAVLLPGVLAVLRSDDTPSSATKNVPNVLKRAMMFPTPGRAVGDTPFPKNVPTVLMSPNLSLMRGPGLIPPKRISYLLSPMIKRTLIPLFGVLGLPVSIRTTVRMRVNRPPSEGILPVTIPISGKVVPKNTPPEHNLLPARKPPISSPRGPHPSESVKNYNEPLVEVAC